MRVQTAPDGGHKRWREHLERSAEQDQALGCQKIDTLPHKVRLTKEGSCVTVLVEVRQWLS